MGFDIKSRTNTYGLTGRSLRVAITATAVTAFSFFGYDQGLMSGLITGPQFNHAFPATDGIKVNQGGVTAAFEIGCLFGAMFVLFKGDDFGRRPLIIAGSIIITIGAIISTLSFKDNWALGQFVVGRVITGLGNGLNTATVPVWQSEMSRAENRGRLVCLEGAVVAVGTFIAYWIDFGFSYINNSAQWRFPVGFQCVFSVILFFAIIQLPESPRWLIAHGRNEEARLILGKLNNLEPDSDIIVSEQTVISDAIKNFDKEQAGFMALFTGGKTQHFQRMLLGVAGQFWQQFGGCNAAIYYSTVLFEESIGLDRRLALVLGGVFATVYALSTIPSFFLIDTLGRRKLFFIGSIGQGVAFLIAFACLVNQNESNSIGAAVALFIFIIFFAFTMLPLPWIYPPEINPLKTRTVASSVSTCTNWICNFAVVMFTPVFIEASGWGCYLYFSIMNFLFVPVIFFFYPETAGRQLEEIDIIFAKAHVENRQPWRVAATLPKLSNDEIEQHGRDLGLYKNFDDEEKSYETDSNMSKPNVQERDVSV
ncbi:sugar transporter Stl1p [[Candida] jaroonii]|uniref:Sugar transporter Stl1p n=1 Tax=[Candida] jaroonii TaxID=467808 RepID=A0ACA9YG92_9ASCO|nr:sugar transporter Stl1p [[Candida] jaroonii]